MCNIQTPSIKLTEHMYLVRSEMTVTLSHASGKQGYKWVSSHRADEGEARAPLSGWVMWAHPRP